MRYVKIPFWQVLQDVPSEKAFSDSEEEGLFALTAFGQAPKSPYHVLAVTLTRAVLLCAKFMRQSESMICAEDLTFILY